jgi:hypothetical protein
MLFHRKTTQAMQDIKNAMSMAGWFASLREACVPESWHISKRGLGWLGISRVSRLGMISNFRGGLVSQKMLWGQGNCVWQSWPQEMLVECQMEEYRHLDLWVDGAKRRLYRVFMFYSMKEERQLSIR